MQDFTFNPEVEQPKNFEQKCHCVLVLDVSGSMAGQPIDELNRGLQEFQREVTNDFTASQRLEVSIITFSSTVQCVQEPALITDFQMPTLTTTGTTKLVDAVRMGMTQIETRKAWYKNTGQKYYRSILVLITDGEPDKDQDMDSLASEVISGVNNKKFIIFGLGVRGYNHTILSKICPPDMPPKALDGYKFSEFFKWLSNSISIITASNEGAKVSFSSTDGWAQQTI